MPSKNVRRRKNAKRKKNAVKKAQAVARQLPRLPKVLILLIKEYVKELQTFPIRFNVLSTRWMYALQTLSLYQGFCMKFGGALPDDKKILANCEENIGFCLAIIQKMQGTKTIDLPRDDPTECETVVADAVDEWKDSPHYGLLIQMIEQSIANLTLPKDWMSTSKFSIHQDEETTVYRM